MKFELRPAVLPLTDEAALLLVGRRLSRPLVLLFLMTGSRPTPSCWSVLRTMCDWGNTPYFPLLLEPDQHQWSAYRPEQKEDISDQAHTNG